MGPRRGTAVILAAAAVCLLLAGLGAYGSSAVLDRAAFADRAVTALDSDEVREEVAARLAARIVAERPQLGPRELELENAAKGDVTRSLAFRIAFHGAAARLHHTLFSDPDATASLRVPGSGAALQAELARRRPALADPSLLTVETGGVQGTLRRLAPPAADLARPLTIAFAIAGLALLTLGIARAPDRRRSVWRAGMTVGTAGGLVAAGVIGARDVLLRQFDTGFGDAVVAAIWNAYLADLRMWALGAGAAGLVVAAAAGGRRPALPSPTTAGGRLLRAGALLGAAALAVALPALVLHIGLVALAAVLVYVAAGDLVRVVAPPESAGRRVRAAGATAGLLALIALAAVPAI